MVQALNLILLTSSELSKLRNLLRGSLVTREGKELLVALYASWCHSPVAIISLCLLSQAYQHASVVIQSLVEEDMNVKFFVQLDKLIRLLETPIFTYLRLQLLEPGRYPWLLKTLYGLLMLLPQQSGAFRILQTRLKTVPTYSFSNGGDQISRAFSGVPFSQYMMHHHEDGDAEDYNINSSHQGINFAARLQQFENVQNQHRGQARIKRTTLIAPPLLLHQRTQSTSGKILKKRLWSITALNLPGIDTTDPFCLL
ncbi:hypothetical protein F2Q70_00031657 [Brassica cretica]|uniref:Vacuolar protein 14 C-terminal Fig4-binding domain-containing protein n=1 Tax=Brassica cretica TaxID=69181 RepID=A0A8S9FM83_BRACR|nr:hypothetical protein F2Q70_00031657 [Brassica cretica]